MTNHLQLGGRTADVGPSLLGRMASPFFFHPDTTSEKKRSASWRQRQKKFAGGGDAGSEDRPT